MSQRDNRYRDFQAPNDFEEFKRMRAQMSKPQAPVSPSSPSGPASPSNRIPVSVSNSARSRNVLLNQQQTGYQEIPIPLTSSAKSTADSASSRNKNITTTSNSPASSGRNSSSNTKPKVQIQQPSARNFSVDSSSRSRSPNTTSQSPEEGAQPAQQNPARTRPPLQHQNSVTIEPPANKVSLHDVARTDRQSRRRQNFNSVGNYSRESTPETSLTHGEWLAKKNQERRSAERNNNPNESRILKEKEFGWKHTDSLNSIPPNEFTISHINQHHDMLVRL